jgi:hypothetical protein
MISSCEFGHRKGMIANTHPAKTCRHACKTTDYRNYRYRILVPIAVNAWQTGN